MGRAHGPVLLGVEVEQGTAGQVVVELFVVELAAGELLQPDAFRHAHAGSHVVDRVHGARIVDVVGGDQGGIHGARSVGPRQLVHEIMAALRLVRVEDEQAVDPQILCPHRRTEVCQLRALRVGGRVHRARAHVAKAAGHADPVGPHQILAVVIARIGVVALGVPSLCGLGVKGGIGEQAQADDAAGITIVGAYRLSGTVAKGLTPGADGHARVLGLVFEGVRCAVLAAHVEPQAAAVWIGALRLVEAGLVEHPEVLPAGRAGVAEAGVGADDLEQIEGTEGVAGHLVPEAVVAAAPDDPHIAPRDLLRREGDAAVHVVEPVLRGLPKGCGVPPSPLGLVEDLSGLRLLRASGQPYADTDRGQSNRFPEIQGHSRILFPKKTMG